MSDLESMVCVGGPLNGTQYRAAGEYFRVVIPPVVDGYVTFWAPEGQSTRKSLEFLLSAYLNEGQRPK